MEFSLLESPVSEKCKNKNKKFRMSSFLLKFDEWILRKSGYLNMDKEEREIRSQKFIMNTKIGTHEGKFSLFMLSL